MSDTTFGTGNDVTSIVITCDLWGTNVYPASGSVALQIKKDGVWVTLLTLGARQTHVITLSGDKTELAKYVQSSGGNYTSVQLRTRITGSGAGSGVPSYGAVWSENAYLNVSISYESASFNPI
jgi:hypothetical protein